MLSQKNAFIFISKFICYIENKFVPTLSSQIKHKASIMK